MLRLSVLVLALATPSLAAGGCDGATTASDDEIETGTLGTITGSVSIGPLCPVETIPPDPACQPTPETFAGLLVLVTTTRQQVVREVAVDGQGRFAVRLPAGRYVVTTNRDGLGVGGTVPVQVDLAAGEVEEIRVEVDTGIR